jgi:hypothetical protein
MSGRKDEKWLDDQLQRAVNGSTPVFDAQAWKQKYSGEYKALLSRGRQNVGWGLPHRSGTSRRLWWGKPHPTARILRSSLGKVAIAAAIIVAAGVLLAGRLGIAPKKSSPEPQPVAQQSPAQMVSMISLSAAFRSGGMEGLDRQCERALERLGPRPTSVSMQELLKDISGKGQERTSI